MSFNPLKWPIFFDQVEFAKIPIWENQRRIKALWGFRNLYIDRIKRPPGNRSEINQQKPAIQKMVALAGIEAYRATRRTEGGTIDIDALADLFELEIHRVRPTLPVDVIEEAIGVYRDDQAKSWFRTFWPFFWLARLVDWMADRFFNLLVALVGADPNKAKSSSFGRVFTALKELTLWVATVVATIVAVLEFLGYETSIRRFLHLQ